MDDLYAACVNWLLNGMEIAEGFGCSRSVGTNEFELTSGILQESVLVFVPYHWNGIIIISIIINQNHNNNIKKKNNKNIQMMDTVVIQNTQR